jgi:hypothetical protein
VAAKEYPTNQECARHQTVPSTASHSQNATALTLCTNMPKKKEDSVEELLGEIRNNTAPSWWRIMINGFLTGAGWVLGTVLTFAALGYILSFFGVIPGFSQIAAYLQSIVNTKF